MAGNERKSLFKRILRWVITALGGIALLYAVALVIWSLSFSPDKIVEQLGAFAEADLDARLSVEKTSLTVFPSPSIHLEGVQLAPRQGLPLSAKELSIAMEFIPALWGEVRPSAITITHAQIPILEDAQGRMALGGFLPNYAAGRHTEFHGHIYIKQSALGWFPRGGRGNTTVESADYDGDVELGADGGFRLHGGIKLQNISRYGDDSSRLMFDGLNLGFNGGISIAGDGSGWEIDRGKLWLGGVGLDITASSKQTADGPLQSQWHITGSDVDLTALADALPDAILPPKTDLNLGGRLALDLQSQTLGDDTTLKGHLEVEDGTCSLKGERDGIAGINGRINFDGDTVEFTGVEGATAGKPIKLSGKLTDPSHPNWDINLNGKIPLGIVAKLCGMTSDWRLTGTVSINAHMTGSPSDPANLHLGGSLSPENATLATPYLGKPFTNISGEIKLNDSSLTAGLVAKLGDGNLTLSGSMTGWVNPTLDIKVGGDTVDLDQALEKAPKIKGTTSPGKPPAIKCEVSLARCKLFGINTENLRCAADFSAGMLNIKRLTANGYGGNLVLNGQIDLRGQLPSYSLKVDLSNIDINQYLSAETEVKDGVLGRLDAHFTMKASGTDRDTVKKSLTAGGTAALGKGRIKSLAPLDRLAEWSGLGIYRDLAVDSVRVGFGIKDGRVVLKDVKASGRDIDLSLSGTIGLDLLLDLKVQNNYSLQYAQNVLGTNRPTKMVRDVRGRGVLAFIATGESGDPDFRLDPKAMGQQVLEDTTSDAATTGNSGQKSLHPPQASTAEEETPTRKWF